MKILLDTHTFIWWDSQQAKLAVLLSCDPIFSQYPVNVVW